LGLTTVLSVMMDPVCGCSLVLTSLSTTGCITWDCQSQISILHQMIAGEPSMNRSSVRYGDLLAGATVAGSIAVC
jgi:hypothetical protein